MTKRKLVSIIIAVYNMEELLVRCLNSVRNQTYDNLEIIVVDDGSIDHSAVLCDSFSMVDSRIKVFHKKNGGLSSARNVGIEQASGEYLFFVDSDDYVESDLVEKTIQIMESMQSDWCGFRAIKEDNFGNTLYKINFKTGEFEIERDKDKWMFLLGPFLNYLVGWEACFHVYKRSIIEKYKLRFVDEHIIYAEDMLFSFCYLLYVNKVVTIPAVLYHYTKRERSLVEQSKKKNVLPQIHQLADQLYNVISDRKLVFFKNNFTLIYLSLIEWHARFYIQKYGTKWVQNSLKDLCWRTYIPKNYFPQLYQSHIELYGFLCGVISVIIVIMDFQQKEETEKYLEKILCQSIQRLDIVIICKKGCFINNSDYRIRYIYIENETNDLILKTGFEKGFGEFIFFADIKEDIDNDFLRRFSDAIKYNQCDSGIISKKIEETKVYKNNTVTERKEIRKILERISFQNEKILFRKDLLQKSGLGGMNYLSVYKKDIILSGKVIFLKVNN